MIIPIIRLLIHLSLRFSSGKECNEGYSAYFKFYLRKEIDGYLKDYEKETGRPLNLFRDGLKFM
jgi:penicillin-binding protein 1A